MRRKIQSLRDVGAAPVDRACADPWRVRFGLFMLAASACATSNPGSGDDARQSDSVGQESSEALVEAGSESADASTAAVSEAQASRFVELHARLDEVSGDPEPEKIVRGTHYWVSNELSQGLFHPYIDGAGGVFMGVGTDQCYLLAAWQEADSIILMDFDRYVVALHHAYRAFFLASATPEEFVAWWHEERDGEARSLLEASIDDPAQRGLVLDAFEKSGKMVRLRLSRLRKQYGSSTLGSFVTDAEQFLRIKGLYESNRVTIVRGDLVGPTAVQEIGGVLHEFGVAPQVLYLSNAEQYFRYSRAFTRNVEALGLSPDSRVLRTLSHRRHGFAEGELYHYNIQTGESLKRYLAAGRLTSSARMLTEKQRTGTLGLSTLGDLEAEPME